MDPSPDSLESQFIQRVALDSIHPDLALAEMLAKFPGQSDQLHSLHAAYAIGSQAIGAQETAAPEEFVAAGVARQYEHRGELGVGGGGEVRLVWDPRLRRELAMKILPRGMTVEGSAVSLARGQRFLNEARLTGSLEHPGVIPVHDMGVDDHDQPFFTMQRVSGRTFSVLIDELHAKSPAPEDSWSLERIVGALLRVCETMAFAHSKGVLHRDLKSANLMVGSYGEVYVMDWGLAQTPEASQIDTAGDTDVYLPKSEEVGLTMDGEVLGTPSFMAPEQADGVLGELDQRADVYSLGAVLYHVLAGHAPYREPGSSSDAYELLKCLRKGEPRDPGLAPTDAPEALLAICRKAMSRDRTNRYPSAKSLGRDLRAWSEGRVVSAHRTGVGIEIVKWVQRNRAVAGSLALVGVVGLAGVVSFLSLRAKSIRELSQSNYLGTITRISQSLEDGETANVLELMGSIDPEQQGWEYGYLRARLLAGQKVFGAGIHEKNGIRFVDLSDDGRFLLSGDSKGVVALWDTTRADGESAASLLRVWRGESIIEQNTGVTDLHLFADGSAFVVNFSNLPLLHCFDCTTEKLRFNAPAKQNQWQGLSLSSDGQLIATLDDQGRVHLLNSHDGSPVDLPMPEQAPSVRSKLCVIGPGPQLAYTDGGVGVLTSERDLSPLPPKSSESLRSIISDYEGKRIAARNNRGSVWIWDRNSNTPIPYQLSAGKGGVGAIAFGPQGNRLVLAQGPTLELWDIDARRRLSIREGHGSKVQSVAWSAGGSMLASGALGGELRLWDPAAVGTQSIPLPDGSKVHDVNASATRLLMTKDGTTGTWDLATGTFEPIQSSFEAPPLMSVWGSDESVRFDFDFKSKILVRTDSGVRTAERDLTQLGTKFSEPRAAQFIFAVPGRPWLLVSESSAGPCILDKTTLELIRTLEVRGIGRSYQLTDDNSKFAYSKKNVRYLVDLETGLELEQTEPHADDSRFWISPDGSRVAILCDDKRELRLVDRSSGEELVRTSRTDSVIVAGIWTKAGDRFITAARDGFLYVWHADSGKQALRLNGTTAVGRSLHRSKDGLRIVLAGQGEAAVYVSSGRENQPK